MRSYMITTSKAASFNSVHARYLTVSGRNVVPVHRFSVRPTFWVNRWDNRWSWIGVIRELSEDSACKLDPDGCLWGCRSTVLVGSGWRSKYRRQFTSQNTTSEAHPKDASKFRTSHCTTRRNSSVRLKKIKDLHYPARMKRWAPGAIIVAVVYYHELGTNCAESLTNINSFHCHKCPRVEILLLLSFYRWGNKGIWKLLRADMWSTHKQKTSEPTFFTTTLSWFSSFYTIPALLGSLESKLWFGMSPQK